MLAAALLASLPLLQAPVDVVLERGASLEQRSWLRYWEVADTTLDASRPDEVRGGELNLFGGQGKTVLIAFRNLGDVVPPGAQIESAQLVLTPTTGVRPQLAEVRRVRVPWGEGPSITFANRRRPGPTDPNPTPPAGVATWRDRRTGWENGRWQQPGATGPGDGAVLASAKLTLGDATVSIEVTEAVRAMLARPDENHGFALAFDNECEFGSSDARAGRPQLRIRYRPGVPAAPDIAVIAIERRPGTPRPDLPAPVAKPQAGVEVPIRIGAATGRGWPANGEEVTYVARIRNVGTAPAAGFRAIWSVRERPGAGVDVPKGLAPGEETTLTLRRPFERDADDPRRTPIALRVEPSGPDRDPANDTLEVHESALAVGIGFDPAFVRAIAPESPAVWVQRVIARLNGTVFERSRFSFAAEGVRERVRVQTLSEGPVGPDLTLDAAVTLSGDPAGAERRLLRDLLIGLGVPDLARASRITDVGPAMRPTRDRFPGLTGGGDTRFEGALPPQIPIPYEPVFNPLFAATPLEATDLLAATEVAALVSEVGRRRGYAGEVLFEMPPTVLVRAVNAVGEPLDGVELSFFQTVEGRVPEGLPTFTGTTSGGGTLLLTSRETGEAAPAAGPSGHALRPNPFGRIDPAGGNAAFLVRAEANGQVEWAWLKSWQLTDAFFRGNRNAVVAELRFNLPPAPIDATVDLSTGKVVTDRAETLPTALAVLVDGNLATGVPVAAGPEDWLEIDLGRDRPIGEVQLTFAGTAVPAAFDLLGYSTGQRPEDAQPWARELDFDYTRFVRGGGDTVVYRGPAVRVRFLRLVFRSAPPRVEVREIQVRGLQG